MGRAPCCEKKGLKKGPWTPEEDEKLIQFIKENGQGSWRSLPKSAGLARCGKSCRLRWANYLRPDIKRGRFSFEEEEAIIQLHSVLGNKWSAIAARLPGRTDNEIKNYWNTHIRKRLLRMGIDPVTHRPRLDLLDLSSFLAPSLYNPTQLSLSRLLGLQPQLNSEILRLATNLLGQNLQLNQFSNPETQNPITPTQIHQLQTSNPPDFSCQSVGLNPWEGKEMQLNVEDFVPYLNNGCFTSTSDHATILESLIPENSDFQFTSIDQEVNFNSVLSTPASSPPQLNSSSTWMTNASESPTHLNSSLSYINSSAEERDNYCTEMLMLEMPDFSDLNEFM